MLERRDLNFCGLACEREGAGGGGRRRAADERERPEAAAEGGGRRRKAAEGGGRRRKAAEGGGGRRAHLSRDVECVQPRRLDADAKVVAHDAAAQRVVRGLVLDRPELRGQPVARVEGDRPAVERRRHGARDALQPRALRHRRAEAGAPPKRAREVVACAERHDRDGQRARGQRVHGVHSVDGREDP